MPTGLLALVDLEGVAGINATQHADQAALEAIARGNFPGNVFLGRPSVVEVAYLTTEFRRDKAAWPGLRCKLLWVKELLGGAPCQGLGRVTAGLAEAPVDWAPSSKREQESIVAAGLMPV